MKWRIFYGDRTTFGHEDGDVSDAPWCGVITIVQDCYDIPEVIHQCDDYWWRPDWGRWTGGDIQGFRYQSAKYGATWLKQGETIKPESNREIMAAAIKLKDEWSGRH